METIFAESFLNGMFYALCIGTAFNFLLSLFFFIKNKKKWNINTWSSFYAPIGLLVLTVAIGFIK